ncbi:MULTISPECIES: hypothetical protein [Lactobacillus]|uniref:Uncharacterized protein n=1 Tax=Lactobacillus xujianguonis TaxID=2495899 RepID=A0A437SSC0_9LACO|nr:MULTISPECIES: hypothetical protein [Lactobacillus]RVU69839.1 hypothetical protein EJK17_10970 [Lactobacillus xujianguonis]RVU77448.1 hypothetical protein EJK20_01425 [Lactobacillus xujianguonis]
MNENLPRLLYFKITNTHGIRLYTLHQDEKAVIEVAVYIPDNIIGSKAEDGDFFIQWTINGKNIQYDDIPIQEIIKTGKRIAKIKLELDVYLQDSINLNLSLGAKYSDISPQEQIVQFSFFKTIIERKKTIFATDSMGKRPVPPTDKVINDFKDRSNSKDKDKHDKEN